MTIDLEGIIGKALAGAMTTALLGALGLGWAQWQEMRTFMVEAKARWAVEDAQTTGFKRMYRRREGLSREQFDDKYFKKEQRLRHTLDVPTADAAAAELLEEEHGR